MEGTLRSTKGPPDCRSLSRCCCCVLGSQKPLPIPLYLSHLPLADVAQTLPLLLLDLISLVFFAQPRAWHVLFRKYLSVKYIQKGWL